jgi:hypothetical protein
MENPDFALAFNFFDFLTHLAHFSTKDSHVHLLYLEYPLIGTAELLKPLMQVSTSSGKEAIFIFSNSSLLILTRDPKSFLMKLRQQEIYKKFLRGKLNSATLNLKKFESPPALLFQKFYEKIRDNRRHLHIPNIESYKRVAELIDSGNKEIFVDLPEENPFLAVEALQILANGKVTFAEEEKGNFLTIRNEKGFKKIRLISDPNSSIKIDSITIEDVQKTLQSFFISPNVNREILELLYYRSMKSYSKLIWILKVLNSKNFFRWDENSGWVLNENSAFPYEEYYPEKSQKFFESMSKDEKLVTYVILSSAEPVDKTDLIKLFPKVKTQNIEKIIENLSNKGILRIIKNKIHPNHPVVEFHPLLNLPEREVKKIHGHYAQLLHTKKMNGFPVATWEIARQFELSGDYKNAFKFYYEAINEELKKEQYEKAYQHAKKAKLFAKTKRQKSSINETIINLFISLGEYQKALEYINGLKTEAKEHKRLIPKIIELLTELGETKTALQILKEYHTQQKRLPKELLLLKLKIDYNADKLECNTQMVLEKFKSKSSGPSQNGKVNIFETMGDCEFYNNKIRRAIEYYMKALKASKSIEKTTFLELKLAEMLLLAFKFHDALTHIENVLWSLNEIKNKHLKETLLEEIGKIYLYLLPPRSAESFIRFSIDDILNISPKTNYPYRFYLGLLLVKSGSTKEGLIFAKQGINTEKKRGNTFKANLMLLALIQNLLKNNETEEARTLLEGVETKSEYIFTRKRLLEILLRMLQNDNCEADIKEIKELVSMNPLNALAFYEIAENIKNSEIEHIRNSLLNKYEDFKNALAEVDLWSYYPN